MKAIKLLFLVAALSASAILSGGSALAGCDLNLRISNTGAGEVRIDLRNSQSKIKMGVWLNFKGRIQGVDDSVEFLYIAPGDTFAGVLKSDFGCDQKRRFRFANSCGERDRTGNFREEDDKEKYEPSDDGWTEARNVNVEISRCLADY